MVSYPTILEPSWAHVRHRTRPLASMPTMWQANNDKPNIYHSSHCDLGQAGWRKWAADTPDLYTRSRVPTVPDWYSRREANITHNDFKERRWPWEGTSKPTEKKAFGWKREDPRPVPAGDQYAPRVPYGQVEVPQWGLYNPPRYNEPSRVEPLPPIHGDMMHYNCH